MFTVSLLNNPTAKNCNQKSIVQHLSVQKKTRNDGWFIASASNN